MTAQHTFLLLLILPFLTSAVPLPQNSNQQGEDVPSGGIGFDPNAQGSADTGNAGTDTGAVKLSKGATIAISVVVGIVVIVGISTAVLFFIAKRRQWRLAETMRRSVKRVTTGITRVMTPRTPHKMTFSPIEKSRNGSAGADLLPSSKNKSPERAARTTERGVAGLGVVEKALPAVREDVRDSSGSRSGSSQDVNQNQNQEKSMKQGQRQKPVPPKVQVPQSKFEMDSPKTPLWNKVFGR